MNDYKPLKSVLNKLDISNIRDLRIEETDFRESQKSAEQLFGHVILVQAYDVDQTLRGSYPTYEGTRALVKLRDEDRIVAVVTQNERMQGTLETALATENLMYFFGRLEPDPYLPLGGTTSTDFYQIYEVCVYGNE